MNLLRVGMLHLAPQLGRVEHNRSLIEAGVDLAAEQGVGLGVDSRAVRDGLLL